MFYSENPKGDELVPLQQELIFTNKGIVRDIESISKNRKINYKRSDNHGTIFKCTINPPQNNEFKIIRNVDNQIAFLINFNDHAVSKKLLLYRLAFLKLNQMNILEFRFFNFEQNCKRICLTHFNDRELTLLSSDRFIETFTREDTLETFQINKSRTDYIDLLAISKSINLKS